ncbi:MAG: hypothetical protein IPJ65_23850 [Archangiaceae bacterium]|nr:hypothetical protein [Archangiaceae bacterium]
MGEMDDFLRPQPVFDDLLKRQRTRDEQDEAPEELTQYARSRLGRAPGSRFRPPQRARPSKGDARRQTK